MITTGIPRANDILIVHRRLESCRRLASALEPHGFDVRHARDAAEALALSQQRKPLLIISDIGLPGGGAFELCGRIRADASLAEIPVMFLTADPAADDLVRAMEAGVDAFVAESAAPSVVVTRVREAIQRRAAAARVDELIRTQEELRGLNERLEQIVRDRTAALIAEVTERARVNAERESLLESTSEGIFGVDTEGRCTFINRRGAELLGYEPARLIGVDMHQVLHPSRSEGAALPLEQSPVFRAYRGGVRCDAESGMFARRDGTAFPVEYSAAPIYDRQSVRGAVVAFRDVTERKKLEAEVLRANRVESVGRLASGIAHDMNNILAPIMMSVPLLRMPLTPEEVGKTLATIESSAKRGADLVRQLLIFGRGIEGMRGPVSPRKLVDEMASIVRETFPRNIAIQTHVAKGAWAVRGDATQINQVLLNLCVNARDAMPDGGTLTIAAENLHIDPSYAAMHDEAKPGAYVLLRVVDTGVGIPPEVTDKIFEPFFTTKDVGRGTGLGLSTVLGIVKSHGGFVRVRSEVGRGSEFLVYLPAIAGEAGTEDEPSGEEVPKGNGELVLLVDDEDSIRTVLRETLQRKNYRVETARDGAEASAVFARHAADVALVVTDLDMPFLDGMNLIRVLRRLSPSVKIIVSSGMGDGVPAQERLAELKALGVRTVLTKPYTADKFLDAVHRAIAGTRATKK